MRIQIIREDGIARARYADVPRIVLTCPASSEDRAKVTEATGKVLGGSSIVLAGERAGSVRVGHAIGMVLATRLLGPTVQESPALFLEDDAAPAADIGKWVGWPEDADLVYLGFAHKNAHNPDLPLKHMTRRGWWRIRGGLLTSHALLFVTPRAVEVWKEQALVALDRRMTADAAFAEVQAAIKVYAPTQPAFVQWTLSKQKWYEETRGWLNDQGKVEVHPDIPLSAGVHP